MNNAPILPPRPACVAVVNVPKLRPLNKRRMRAAEKADAEVVAIADELAKLMQKPRRQRPRLVAAR